MSDILRIDTINDINKLFNRQITKHPLIAIINYSQLDIPKINHSKISTGLYSISLKNHCPNKIKYGRKYYDFQEGTLLCMSPGQVISIEEQEEVQETITGWSLYFHPDLIRGSALANKMKEYTFFSYEISEALHLSDAEKQTLNDCIVMIENELNQNIDKHSQTLIVSNIELLLNYCTRYYDRQFITRNTNNKDVLIKLETILAELFNTESLNKSGLPTVKQCANQINLSPNYLSDLLKRETGRSAQDHIHYYMIEEAKNHLLHSDISIGEIAYALGFEYPQYFSKIFKKKTGLTPVEYRNMN